MPVYVEKLTSEVTVLDGDLPLTPAQIEKLVKLVLSRIEQRQRDVGKTRESTELRRGAAPPMRIGE